MSIVRYISDLHIGHENMAKHRGFTTWQDMWEKTKANWNKVVHKKDTVIIGGDVTMENKILYPLLNQLKGRKIVVGGNHDEYKHCRQLLNHVDQLCGVIQKNGYFITHIPIHPRELEFRVRGNIHGHLHEYLIEDSRYINISCEHNDYTPMTLEQLQSPDYKGKFKGSKTKTIKSATLTLSAGLFVSISNDLGSDLNLNEALYDFKFNKIIDFIKSFITTEVTTLQTKFDNGNFTEEFIISIYN